MRCVKPPSSRATIVYVDWFESVGLPPFTLPSIVTTRCNSMCNSPTFSYVVPGNGTGNPVSTSLLLGKTASFSAGWPGLEQRKSPQPGWSGARKTTRPLESTLTDCGTFQKSGSKLELGLAQYSVGVDPRTRQTPPAEFPKPSTRLAAPTRRSPFWRSSAQGVCAVTERCSCRPSPTAVTVNVYVLGSHPEGVSMCQRCEKRRPAGIAP